LRLYACGSTAVLALVLSAPGAALGHIRTEPSPFEIASPLSPLSAESSRDTSVVIGLTVARTNPVSPTLDLRGRSVDSHEPGAYKVDAHVSRIPCPGEYRFHAATEDTSNGDSSSYSALLRLFSPSAQPPGVGCGGAAPSLPGRMSVRLQDRTEELFSVTGGRSNAGPFAGDLLLSSVPECDKTYVLEATLDLAHWDRSVEFKVQAIKLNATVQRRTIEDKRC